MNHEDKETLQQYIFIYRYLNFLERIIQIKKHLSHKNNNHDCSSMIKTRWKQFF